MLNLILSGVIVSMVVEILKKKNKFDKVMTLWSLILSAIVVALIAMWVLKYEFWPSLAWILVFAGAFYAYVLRNIRGTNKPVMVIKKAKKKK